MQSVDEITDAQGLEGLRDGWNALLERGAVRSVFLTHEWCSAWWRHFGSGRRLRVLVARGDSGVEAILPLVETTRRRRGVSTRRLEPIGSGLSDRLGIVARLSGDEAPVAALARHLAAALDWDEIVLRDWPVDGEVSKHFAAELRAAGLRVDRRRETRCYYLAMEGSWEEFYETRISAKARREERQKSRKLAAMGALRSRRLTDVREDPEALAAIFALEERETSHGATRHRPFDGEPGRSFFREIAERFSARGWLDVHLLELDGALIAYRLGFRFRGVWSDYFTGFASEHTKLSPGRVLLPEVVHACFELGLAEIDFLRGDEEWKTHWTTSFRWNGTLRVRGPSLRRLVRRTLRTIRGD